MRRDSLLKRSISESEEKIEPASLNRSLVTNHQLDIVQADILYPTKLLPLCPLWGGSHCCYALVLYSDA